MSEQRWGNFPQRRYPAIKCDICGVTIEAPTANQRRHDGECKRIYARLMSTKRYERQKAGK